MTRSGWARRNGPRPGVTRGQGDHPGPVLAGDQHRVARLAVVGGHRHARAGRVARRSAAAPRRRRPAAGPPGRSPRRRSSSGTAASPAASEEPMPVRQSGLCTVITPGSVDRHRAGDHHDGRRAAGAQQRRRPGRPAAPRRSRPAPWAGRAAALARGEQDPGDPASAMRRARRRIQTAGCTACRKLATPGRRRSEPGTAQAPRWRLQLGGGCGRWCR